MTDDDPDTVLHCPLCPTVLDLPEGLSDAAFARQVRMAGWFIQGGQMVCWRHR
jgi:hypothetical protein